MDRLDDQLSNKWHVALNRFNTARTFQMWMYDAKHMADEIPRIAMRFMQERTGQLPKIHRQCSHSESQPIQDNHLTCCLGNVCRECPFLLALEQADVTPEQLDLMKAWTCASHIIQEKAKHMIDDSEGFILDEGDKMFWQQFITSMSQGDME
jgi:hypothetical protein